MNARIVVAVMGALLTTTAAAQSDDEKAALDAVNRMFQGMRTADTTMVRSVFAEGARFAMISSRSTPPTVTYQTIDGWVRGIGTSAGRWDEQIYNVQVRVDGNMAHLWTPYTFYLDNKVRHCGINSIELLKDATGWKVTQLSDTRKLEGCPDPLKK
jgi:hypothetical protein